MTILNRNLENIRYTYWYSQAYRHNLQVLQSFGYNNFPLENYIVDIDKEISAPPHVLLNTRYRLTNGRHGAEARSFEVKITNKDAWPSSNEFNLNESQFEAFRAALTKQLVVIQGPPGKINLILGIKSGNLAKCVTT